MLLPSAGLPAATLIVCRALQGQCRHQPRASEVVSRPTTPRPPLGTEYTRTIRERRGLHPIRSSVRRGDSSTTEEEWRRILTAGQFHVLREGGTEAAHSGEYNRTDTDGLYRCAGCHQPLYSSDTKFVSACGWPAFYEELPGAVTRQEDRSMGLVRTEITCSNCGGHLGHVFEGEGFPTPTDARHCVNSVALALEEKPIPDSERRVNPVLENLRWAGE